MTRLQSELHRLYLPRSGGAASPATESASLINPDGWGRAMVIALARPADWDALSIVWQAVQSDLLLPAPAIAVSGLDGYQLWFSLEEAVSVGEAHVFLETLRDRYLSHIASSRIQLLPALDAVLQPCGWHVDMLPVKQVNDDQWSAFVAPDLAPIFAETPWLDIPPSPEGQADLLSRLSCIKPMAWQLALAQLRPESDSAAILPAAESASPRTSDGHLDAKRFLLKVMNDETIDLALRIEAAKALLPYRQSSAR